MCQLWESVIRQDSLCLDTKVIAKGEQLALLALCDDAYTTTAESLVTVATASKDKGVMRKPIT